MNCPCGSQLPYLSCCGRFHLGKDYPKTAEELMRSRYSAYAKKHIDYILKTTHPDHPDAQEPLPKRRKNLLLFSENTHFEKLEILSVEEGFPFSKVTFRATLRQNNERFQMTETSLFENKGGFWLYLKGELTK